MYFQKAPLIMAIENFNSEIVKLLLNNKTIDVNCVGILESMIFIKFPNKSLILRYLEEFKF